MTTTGSGIERHAPPAGAPITVLENEALALTAIPQWGGKLISLRSKRSGAEWLHPPLRPYAEARRTEGFEQGDGGGWDECLPSVAASGDAPDHGDLWRQPWRVASQPGGNPKDALELVVDATSRPLRFRRRIALAGERMELEYAVENLGSAPTAFLYSAHPLFSVEQGDRIALPALVRSLRVEYSAGDRLGARGGSCRWPHATDRQGRQVDLSTVGPRDGRTAEKLFAGPLTEGWGGLYRPRYREGLVVRFDSSVLPYLGLWICHGAWPEGAAPAKQYTVALEPTTSPCDGLEEAEANGGAPRLAPGQSVRWRLRIDIVGNGGFEEFARLAGRGQE